MAQIPEHLIDRIRLSVNIVDVISRYVSLKKRGKNFIGQCPFHTEKTPSFTVSPDKQIYHCFGCGAGGNVFNFLMQYEKINFIEAVKKLAEETGIELPREQERTRQSSEYDRLYQANHYAAELYHRFLKQNYGTIKEYLEKRGISPEFVDTFKIGLSPDKWDFLLGHIRSKNGNPEIFLKAGLILKSEKDPSRLYDRFRNRLMFPILNISGRTVAFGGRILKNDPNSPKYLNSPESAVYKKSEILFGLNFSKEWIRQEDSAIFVEGYMDYLQLFQSGIHNVVATSGTALTEQHCTLIQRYTKNIILCYDSDTAGINAADRGGQILFQNNLNVRVLLLPEGEDPDSFVRKNGAPEFFALLSTASEYFDFKIERTVQKYGTASISNKTSIINDLLDSLAAHSNPVKQNFFTNALADKFGLQNETLITELQKKRRTLQKRERRQEETEASRRQEPTAILHLSGAWAAEKDILILLLNYFDHLKAFIFEIVEPEDFLNQSFRQIYIFMQEHQGEKKESIYHKVLSQIEDGQILNLLTADLLQEITNPDKYLNDCIRKLKISRYQAQLESYRQALRSTEAGSSEYLDILAQINNCIQQISEFRKLFSEDKS